jgi:hypothetical protein
VTSRQLTRWEHGGRREMRQHELGGWATVKWRCEKITKVDMKQARLIQPSQDDIDNAYGQLTIQFTSKQTFAAYNSKGKLVAGDPNKIVREPAPHCRRESRLLVVEAHGGRAQQILSHVTVACPNSSRKRSPPPHIPILYAQPPPPSPTTPAGMRRSHSCRACGVLHAVERSGLLGDRTRRQAAWCALAVGRSHQPIEMRATPASFGGHVSVPCPCIIYSSCVAAAGVSLSSC